ncbi:hypothetical protein GN956_G5157 [Arapaima gigas]
MNVRRQKREEWRLTEEPAGSGRPISAPMRSAASELQLARGVRSRTGASASRLSLRGGPNGFRLRGALSNGSGTSRRRRGSEGVVVILPFTQQDG